MFKMTLHTRCRAPDVAGALHRSLCQFDLSASSKARSTSRLVLHMLCRAHPQWLESGAHRTVTNAVMQMRLKYQGELLDMYKSCFTGWHYGLTVRSLFSVNIPFYFP